MMEAILVISWFLLICGVANVLQKHFGYSYNQYWKLHITLILVGIVGAYFITMSATVNHYLTDFRGLLIGIIALATFVLAEMWRGKHIQPENYYGHATLGGAYSCLLSPRLSGIVVKSTDVFFQDLVLLIIVVNLNTLYSLLNLSLIVTFITFLTHLPVFYFMGRIYGMIFTILATVFSLATPLLIDTTWSAFYLIFAFHLLMYPIMMFATKVYQSQVLRP